MGTIRFLLAISVLISHLHIQENKYFLNNGSDSVQLFFIISGFYMFMILKNKYSKIKNAYFYFISNRFLRIYPIYYIVLIITIAYAFYSIKFSPNLPNDFAPFFAFYNQLSNFYLYLLGFLNLSIIGQESLSFFNYGFDNLIFLPENKNILSQFTFIPQAWSIGMEFWFYIFCPFFSKLRTKNLITIIVLIFLIKTYFIYNISNSYNWEYRFIFFELFLFLLGGFIYNNFKNIQSNWSPYIFLSSIIYVCFLNLTIEIYIIKHLFYILFSLSIPLIFKLTKNNKLDKFLGDLSFPIYICHILTINIAKEFIFTNKFLYLSFVILLTILLSIFLLKISNPIEKFRAKRIM